MADRDDYRASDLVEPVVLTVGSGQVRRVSISALSAPETVRLNGLDDDHARALSEASGDLPPILVHADTMRIIDGWHRVRAAELLGETEIDAILFEGDAAAAFVAAVKANVTHGLPLSLADRQEAAARILRLFPDWSNRAVAKVSGLSDGTVGRLRSRSTPDVAQLNERRGLDGRVRRADASDARRRAMMLLIDDPQASLRSVARAVGLSPATVRDVREKMRQGVNPIHPRKRTRRTPVAMPLDRHSRPSALARIRILRNLKKDPSLRLNDAGKELLRWLETHARLPEEDADVIRRIPPHVTESFKLLALECATWWNSLAQRLEHEIPDNKQSAHVRESI